MEESCKAYDIQDAIQWYSYKAKKPDNANMEAIG
jgi:hypothetical protein